MTQIALIGCAHIHTPGFVDRLAKRADIKTKAVWDHDPARAAANAAKLGAAVASGLDEVWSDREISAVVICSETNRHEELVLAAVAAGKHLFVEKPLGYRAADAFKMADEIEQAGLIFQTGYFMRGDPLNRFLKEQIDAGNFGKITRARFANCHAGALKGWFDTDWRWMADPKIAGCGAFGDLGTHSLDLMLWMLGPAEAVTAVIGAAVSRYDDCDEFGEGLIEFKSGAAGVLAGGWVDVANPVPIQLSGTEGCAIVRDGQLYFQSAKVAGADGKTPWEKLPAALPHAFELFLDAVTGQKDVPLVTAREAAERSAVMEALYRGAETKSWVRPADFPTASTTRCT